MHCVSLRRTWCYIIAGCKWVKSHITLKDFNKWIIVCGGLMSLAFKLLSTFYSLNKSASNLWNMVFQKHELCIFNLNRKLKICVIWEKTNKSWGKSGMLSLSPSLWGATLANLSFCSFLKGCLAKNTSLEVERSHLSHPSSTLVSTPSHPAFIQGRLPDCFSLFSRASWQTDKALTRSLWGKAVMMEMPALSKYTTVKPEFTAQTF